MGERVRRGIRREELVKEGEELERKEVKRALVRVKENKAIGIDKIPAEVWKYGGEEVEAWVWEICNRIWKGEGWISE